MDRADLVFKAGAVYTIESKSPKAEVVAVTGKKISYVGSNTGTKARRVAFGTDWPASGYFVSYHPLDAIQVAVTRAILPQYGKWIWGGRSPSRAGQARLGKA